MRLFATAFWIALGHSGRRLLCLFCMLLVGAGVVWGVWRALPQEETPVATIGVVDLDGDPMAASALKLLANSRELSGLFRLEFIAPERAEESAFAAVLTIPKGFTRSVLTGENLSPGVALNAGSPLEAAWARQMAKAGASYLTSAQLGVYAALEQGGAALAPEEYDALVMHVNLAFAREFLDRLSYLERQELSTTGALSLPRYYACALGAALLVSYGFLYAPAVLWARRMRRALHGKRGGGALWLASAAHCIALSLVAVLTVGALGLAAAGSALQAAAVVPLLVLAVLVGAFAMLVSTAARGQAEAALAALLVGLGSALASGGLVPLAVMPPVFEHLAPYLPTGQAAALLGALFGRTPALGLPLCMAAVLLACSLLLWRLDGAQERGRGV